MDNKVHPDGRGSPDTPDIPGTPDDASVVVDKQPKIRPPIIDQNVRDWRVPLRKEGSSRCWVCLGCCFWYHLAYCDICCLCCFCDGRKAAKLLGEPWYYPFFLFRGHWALRVKVRTMNGIKGNLCEDCCLAVCYPHFSYKQILAELRKTDVLPGGFRCMNDDIPDQPDMHQPDQPDMHQPDQPDMRDDAFSTHADTPVTKQPTANAGWATPVKEENDWATPVKEENEWKTPLFSFTDCQQKETVCGPDYFLCTCCLRPNIVYRLDECFLLPCCFFLADAGIRVKVRTMYNIKGKLWHDFLATFLPLDFYNNRQVAAEL